MAVVNLEKALNNVNNFINIDGNRQQYANHFQILKNELFAKLQEDLVFKKLLNGHCLQGSYGDNLKVTLPDEFDSVFVLKLPFNNVAIIRDDVHVPGNVLIDLSEIFVKIQNQNQYSEVFEKLKKLVTPNNFLMVEKVQSWLQSCFQNALTKLEHKIVVNGVESKLTYCKTGPAHCIKVNGTYKYSVDFVPGFIFEQKQNVVKNIDGSWHAIPKPSKPSNSESISFRASYFDQEAKIMKDKKNLKNGLRMMKKFRDSHQNMSNLKSYHIKTIFLWKTVKKPGTFWSSSLSLMVVEMFHDLEHALMNKNLPFFWNEHCNMFKQYNAKQMEDMFKCVNNVKAVLFQAKNQEQLNELLLAKTFNIFLSKDEREMSSLNLSLEQLSIIEPPKQQQQQQQSKQQQQPQQQKVKPQNGQQQQQPQQQKVKQQNGQQQQQPQQQKVKQQNGQQQQQPKQQQQPQQQKVKPQNGQQQQQKVKQQNGQQQQPQQQKAKQQNGQQQQPLQQKVKQQNGQQQQQQKQQPKQLNIDLNINTENKEGCILA